MDSASDIAPGPLVLEKFGQALEAAGIRGQLLAITDSRGIQHKRGPSKWQQRRHQMERNLAGSNAKGNRSVAAKWVQELYDHEQTDFDFDFGARGPDFGATGTMRSGGVTGAAEGEGCSARGAPSGTVVGTAGGLAQNAASSASGGMGGDGAAVADLGATGAASPMMSGGAAGAAAGGSAFGASSGAVLGAAGGSAHNAASSASGGVGADGVRQQQGCIRA